MFKLRLLLPAFSNSAFLRYHLRTSACICLVGNACVFVYSLAHVNKSWVIHFIAGKEDSLVSRSRKRPRINCEGAFRCWSEHRDSKQGTYSFSPRGNSNWRPSVYLIPTWLISKNLLCTLTYHKECVLSLLAEIIESSWVTFLHG